MANKKQNIICEICTDYIDPTKEDEILRNLEKVFSRIYGRKVTITKSGEKDGQAESD